MAKKPIIFALANPDPEIGYPEAKEARPDAIVATGRSDYPNQVNNVLGFPFIFRGALDVRARCINEEMKLAAARALAALAREDVPESVSRAYGGERFRFGPDYIIPKPFDPRVLLWVAPAVAKAAMDSGVARVKVDLERVQGASCRSAQSRSHQVMSAVFAKARSRRSASSSTTASTRACSRRRACCATRASASRCCSATSSEIEEGDRRAPPGGRAGGRHHRRPASDAQTATATPRCYWKLRQRRGVNRDAGAHARCSGAATSGR